jgi:tRNA(fMet)-specific endonuclease VapC
VSFLLDTNICSAHMHRPAGLAHRFIQYSGRLWMPSIVLAELYAGAYMLDNPSKVLAAIDDLRQDVGVLVFNEPCAEKFGRLRGELKRAGFPGNPVDLMIAAVALVHNLTLVTNNTADFEHVPGLRLEDWLLG